MECSAAELVLPNGALTTMIPRSLAAGTSTLSMPTPARATIFSLGSRARDDRIVVTDDPVKFSLTQPEPHVQLYPWLLLQKLEALLGYFVGDNDFHNPAILLGN